MPALAVIIPAAGVSRRFGRDKLAMELHGHSVLYHAVTAFASRRLKDVCGVWIATQPRVDLGADLPQDIRRLLLEYPAGFLTFAEGGDTRAQSVLQALRRLPTDIEWVAVHDAARPLVSQELIDQTFLAAQAHGAAAPALPIALTVKQAVGPLPAHVEKTIPRHTLWAMQTPQIMRRSDLLQAFATCPLAFNEITDDAQLLELAGKPVWLVPGDERNLKMTTPMDLRLAQWWMEGKAEA